MTDRPIADYAMLSDSHSAALVSRDGSVDWLCFPRFDAPSIFARLLDDDAGHFSVRPARWGTEDAVSVQRRYLDDSVVLETRYSMSGGTLVVTDLMPFEDTEEAHDLGTNAPHALIRRITCQAGEVDVTVTYRPRPEYGLMVPILRSTDGGVYHLEGLGRVTLSSTVELDLDDAAAHGRFTLEQGEEAWLAVRYRHAVTDEPDVWTAEEMAGWFEQTLGEWRQWSDVHQDYDGPYRDLVRISGRVLQSLTYRPTGAIIAAPTTSLPEDPGGIRNWDYRYSWVRDTALTIEALRVAACPAEADRFLDWMVRTAGGDLRAGQDLQIMYGVGGEHELGERELPHLDGWRGSAPVRVGNGAWNQRQLDVYGELIDALFDVSEHLRDLSDVERGFLCDLADGAMQRWREPDQGLWEIRGPAEHHLHSKLMCWVAVDRAVQMADELDAGDRVEGWRDCAEEIREVILERGFDDELGAFTQTLDGDRLDASVLIMAIERFLPADDPRMLSTYDAIEEHLTDEHGLVYRYRGGDGLEGEEGTFLLCTFWFSQCLAMAGRVDRATEVFERAASFANDVGLLSEEIDPATGELLGNFPQGFSHIGLVNAASAVDSAHRSG